VQCSSRLRDCENEVEEGRGGRKGREKSRSRGRKGWSRSKREKEEEVVKKQRKEDGGGRGCEGEENNEEAGFDPRRSNFPM